MKRLLVLGVILMALAFVGCTTVEYYPVAVTNNKIGSKVGEVDVEKGGAYAAAQNGGITKIATVELKVTTTLFSVTKVYVVTGE
ncbi:MAG: TRL-like family protein [Treponema sp.]|jgi:hypothetical protein|nr:TRL-like family protein [Treponema sp.]